jgi:hypothetical protein
MDLADRHSATWVNCLVVAEVVALVAVVDIHSLLNFDCQYHFANALAVEMPLFYYTNN